MKQNMLKPVCLLFLPLLLIPIGIHSTPLQPQSAADIKVSASIAPDRIKHGKGAQATVVMEIPAGLHVQSSKPLDKFLVPTKLEISAPEGMKVGSIVYPRPVMRRLKFSKTLVAVYEGRTLIRFSVSAPVKSGASSGEIKGTLRFQACNDEACFPPVSREVKVWLNVE
jgi:thiol:disulfide interchange protein DsbD